MKLNGKTVLYGLGILLVALIVWNDPGGAGDTASNWVSNIGSWFQEAFDKANEFAENVVE